MLRNEKKNTKQKTKDNNKDKKYNHLDISCYPNKP